MMIVGNDIHARLRRLRDRTERQLQDFLEILEQVEAPAAASALVVAVGGRPRGPAAMTAPARAPIARGET